MTSVSVFVQCWVSNDALAALHEASDVLARAVNVMQSNLQLELAPVYALMKMQGICLHCFCHCDAAGVGPDQRSAQWQHPYCMVR
jgi:hypothetical protein